MYTKHSAMWPFLKRYDLFPIFWKAGLYVIGAPYLKGLTLEEACERYNVDVDTLVDRLNRKA